MTIVSNFIDDAEKAVSEFFTNLWKEKLEPLADDALQAAVVFSSAGAEEIATQLGIVGMKIVTDAVAWVETKFTGSATKKAEATAKIAADLSAANIEGVAEHTVNMAIESAVSALNQAKAAQAAETTPAPAADPTAPAAA